MTLGLSERKQNDPIPVSSGWGASSLGDQPEAESPDGLAKRQIRQDEEEPDKTGRCDTFHLAALIMHKRVTRCSQKVRSIECTSYLGKFCVCACMNTNN